MADMKHPFAERLVAAENEIQLRIKEIARDIARDYHDKVSHASPLVLVCVLKGAYLFMADLCRALGDLGLPTKHEFICVSSYGGGTASSGEVRMLLDLRSPIRGQHVLMVEDIVDTARTLDFLLKVFGNRSPASLKMVTLLDKKKQRLVPLRADYFCFDVDDFVVGYGLDYDEKLRELRDVIAFNEEAYKAIVDQARKREMKPSNVPPMSKL